MPICGVQVRPQVMQLEMFTVGFDALARFFLRVRRSSRLAIRWFSNCTSELWQRWRHCNLSEAMGSQDELDISHDLRVRRRQIFVTLSLTSLATSTVSCPYSNTHTHTPYLCDSAFSLPVDHSRIHIATAEDEGIAPHNFYLVSALITAFVDSFIIAVLCKYRQIVL